MAGIGGAVGLQGSDGASLQREAVKRHGVPRGPERLTVFFQAQPSACRRSRRRLHG